MRWWRLALLAALVSGCKTGSSPVMLASSPLDASPDPFETDLADSVRRIESSDDDSTEPKSIVERPPSTIFRSEIERAFAGGPARFLREVSPEPFRLGGRFVGWQITRLFPNDPQLCGLGCGIGIGDVVLAINGDPLQTPQAFITMYERIATLDVLEVALLRENERQVLRFALVEDRSVAPSSSKTTTPPQ